MQVWVTGKGLNTMFVFLVAYKVHASWFLSLPPPGEACFCLELQDGERMEAVMNGCTQPSQLVEQVKAAGKGSVHVSERFLSAQSSIRVTWLEEKVLPFILRFVVSRLWSSFMVLFMVLGSLLQLKNSGNKGRKKENCRWSRVTLGRQCWRKESPNLLHFSVRLLMSKHIQFESA